MHTEQAIFEKFLAQKSLRLTGERLQVLRSALAHAKHFEPEELVQAVRKVDHKVSRATVYRTLTLLLECGLLNEVIETREKRLYERMHGIPHHDHMVCMSCGQILEFRSPSIERLQDSVCAKYGFTPVTHLHQIMGHCAECGRKRKETAKTPPPGAKKGRP